MLSLYNLHKIYKFLANNPFGTAKCQQNLSLITARQDLSDWAGSRNGKFLYFHIFFNNSLEKDFVRNFHSFPGAISP